MCHFGAIQKVHYSGKWGGELTEKVAEESVSFKKLISFTRNVPYTLFFLQLNFPILYSRGSGIITVSNSKNIQKVICTSEIIILPDLNRIMVSRFYAHGLLIYMCLCVKMSAHVS